jgi:hypothetical protein
MMVTVLEYLAKARACITANDTGDRIEYAAIRTSGIDGFAVAQQNLLTPVCLPFGMTMDSYEQLPFAEQCKYWVTTRAEEMTQDASGQLKMTLDDISEKIWDMEAYLFEYLQDSLVDFIARMFDLAQLHAIEGSKLPEKILRGRSKLQPRGFSVKVVRQSRATHRDDKKAFYREYLRAVLVFRKINAACFEQRGPQGKVGGLTEEAWAEANAAKLDGDLVGNLAKKGLEGQPGYQALLQAGRKAFAGTERAEDYDFLKELKGICEEEVAKGWLKLD